MDSLAYLMDVEQVWQNCRGKNTVILKKLYQYINKEENMNIQIELISESDLSDRSFA